MSLLAAESVDSADQAGSRAYCEQLTRSEARNFYYGLKLLPRGKRAAMFALYSYMRLIDDIADRDDGRDVHQRIEQLESWREQTHRVFDGQPPASGHPLWPAFAQMIGQHRMPRQIFDDAITGQRQDLEPEVFETFNQLRDYCYRVAGTVGLASIYVWGFAGGAQTEAMAIDRGIAFQLTNVLRDLREDARRGRIYIPREDLTAMNLSEDDLRLSRGTDAFRDLMVFEIERAESFYEKSAALEERIDNDSRPTLRAMTRIYHGLLRKVANRPQRVLSERVSLSPLSKLIIGWRAAREK